ncbi:hypothetical protein M8994_23005, partial [Brucella sp. 21LCYQ03]|nr:hypothetical protein [Brucella sp. 21LCYQ03]
MKKLLILCNYFIVLSFTTLLAKDAAHRVLISGAAGTFPEFTAQPFSFSVFKSSASSESYADTVILDEIHIHRKIIHPDSLQVH